MKSQTFRCYLVLLSLLAVALLFIRPWADIPLNDDWQYARVVKHFAESGVLRVDVPIAPTLIAQVLAVYPFVKVLGFSHTLLRLLTVVCAIGVLIFIERILALAGVNPARRLWTLILVLFNPLFLYLSLTFMTEIYGLFPPLLAAFLWFRERSRSQSGPPGERSPVFYSWRTVILAALLSSLGYWVRPLGVLAFPALVSAAVIVLLIDKQYQTLRRSLPRFIVGSMICALVVLAYFPFAQWTDRIKPEFSQPLSQVFEPDLANGAFYTGMFFLYATFCLFPLLPRPTSSGSDWKRTLLCAVPVSALCIAGILVAQGRGQPAMTSAVHAGFPFLNNIIYNMGVGPITLGDVYIHNLRHPEWPAVFFQLFQGLLFVVTILGGAALWKFGPFFATRSSLGQPLREIVIFSLVFVVLTLAVVIQCFKWAVFDRYFFNCLVVLSLPLAILRQTEEARGHNRGGVWKGQKVLSAAWFLALILFTTLGIHDYFRWNEVRWSLYDGLRARGISATVIQAGHEVNGWENYDSFVSREAPRGCIGDCSCRVFGWWSLDDSYRVGMNVLDDHIPIEAVKPAYLLADGPPIVVSKRR